MVGKELDARCRIFVSVAEDVSESLHIVDHDPSLALYRLQEHVRKSLPMLVERKWRIAELNHSLQGGCFDLENAIQTVSSIGRASERFGRMNELLRSAMYYKQQLDYERIRREERNRLPHMDSTDSLAQELKKSKSLGQLRASSGGVTDTDLLAEAEPSSTASRSTTSSPGSEYRSHLAAPPSTIGQQQQLHSDASTPTSGADSRVDSDLDYSAVGSGPIN